MTGASSPILGNHEGEKEPNANHSPTRFTAVNGRDMASSASIPMPPPTAELPNGQEDAQENHGTGENDTLLGRDRNGLVTGVNQENQSSLPKVSSFQYGTSNNTGNKRKRSQSEEQQRPQHLHGSTNAPRNPAYTQDECREPSSLPTSSNNTVALHGDQGYKGNSSPTPGYSHHNENDDSRLASTSGSWHEYDSQLASQAQRTQQVDTSDAQLVEALQRETHSNDAVQKNWGTMNRPMEISSQENPLSSMSSLTERPRSAVQVAPKRKRVFSNRTKTGCMTCRRRKKKCDEQHPACELAPSSSRKQLDFRIPNISWQVITALEAVSYAKATRREVPGKNLQMQKVQFPYSRNRTIQTLVIIAHTI